MPQALAVNWREVQTLAIGIGSIREAARQMGVPVWAPLKRAAREGWIVKHNAEREKVEQAKALLREKQGLSSVVLTAVEAMAATGQDSAAKLAVGLNKSANAIAEMDGQEILIASQNVSQIVTSVCKLHGIGSSDGVNLRLDIIAAQSGDCPVIDV